MAASSPRPPDRRPDEGAEQNKTDGHLERVADALERIANVLERWDSEDLLRSDALHGGGTVPALGAITQRLYEIGTILNVTPEDISRLGLASEPSPDLEPLEQAVDRVAKALEHRDARPRRPRRPRPTTAPVSPGGAPDRPASFADREARRHAGGPA